MNTQRLCAECILPENYAGISFNEQGVCNHCEEYKPTRYHGEAKLQSDIDSILSRVNKGEYDCIVGLSGGRDSTYLLWFVIKRLHLKPLAVFVDSGLTPEQTLLNIRRTTEILGVDLVIKQHNFLKRSFRHHLKAWLKRPVPETLITFCVGCRLGLFELLTSEAVERKVPIIFTGSTPFEGKGYKTNLLKTDPTSTKTSSFIFGYGKQILSNPAILLNPLCLKTQFDEYNSKYFATPKNLKRNNIQKISIYNNYIRWEEKIIEETIEKELGWKRYPGSNSSYRGDCEIGQLRQYLYYELLGYNDIDDHLSCLIRDGQITREEALKRVESKHAISLETLKSICNTYDIDFTELEKFITNKRNKTKNIP